MKKNPESIVEGIKDITLVDVFKNLTLAWNNISPVVISKCWRSLLKDGEDEEDTLPLSILKERLMQEKSVTTPPITKEILKLLNTSDGNVCLKLQILLICS